MLSVNPHPPTRGRKKEEKGETYKLNIKSFTNKNLFMRNKAKCTQPILSFPEVGARHWHSASSCRAAPGSPRLASAAGRNWTQGCTDWNQDQGHRQENEQSPLQKLAFDEESDTLMIPQL